MSRIKDTEIYPKFEFRLSLEEKVWLMKELEELKVKFNEEGGGNEFPVINKNTLVVAALRYGIHHLRSREKIEA